nr:right-handed parallel beta-helix repeat-containing protein [Streptomyces sp. RPA4-2]
MQSAANTWYSEVGSSSTTIWANFNGADPNARLAEINVRRQVFAPDVWGLGYITVNGFTIKHAANTYSDFPDSPDRRQAGAISVYGGLKWIIENNIVINARTIGIDIGLSNDTWAGNRPGTPRTDFHNTSAYGSHTVRNNYIAKCGQSGIAGVFSWHSQILYNMIEDTNYRNEFSGAETAPIKVHYMNEGLIKGNYVKNSKGGNSAGIWTDWGNQNVRITGNVVMNSPWGYYAEAVFGPILVDNNVFIGNSDIRTLDATGIVFANNLFLDNANIHSDGSGRNAYYFQPGTMNETTALTSPEKFFWYNNLVQGSTLPNNTTDKTQVKEGNSTGAVSNVHYTATNTQMVLNFDLDASAIHGNTPVTQARVGTIPTANQSIQADVTTDFFGRQVSSTNTMAGPFARPR